MSRFEGSRRPRDTSTMVSLKVDNLTFRTDMQDLDRLFGKYGDLGDIYIPRDWEKGGSRGFAFVRFYKKGDAEDAIDALDGATVDGREIRVQEAKYDRPTSNYVRGGGGRGGRGFGGGGRYQNRSPQRSSNRDRYSRNRSRSRSRSRSYNRRSPSPRFSRSSPARRYHSRSRSRSPEPRYQRSRRSRSR